MPISFLDIPPYDIYFADFGYPIGVLERKVTNPQSQLSISPNPFSKLTEIKIQTQDILLKIYDVSGRIVKVFNLTSPVSLREAERADLLLPVSAVSWDGTNDKGIKLPAGIYFCVVYTDQGNIVEKVVKLK